MPKLVGINHVALEVDSIDEALEFYGRIFDLQLRGRGGRMAFIDIGDQFIALALGPAGESRARHIGLVVDDREATLAAARAAGVRFVGDNDLADPWGNVWQIVDYRDVQFTKTPEILRGMGLAELPKTKQALAELREKGLS